ncbi:Autophagy protein 5 [Yarrowia sp. B02]|nr:Autophagy protein 5 [Yarrowia sp. B02]
MSATIKQLRERFYDGALSVKIVLSVPHDKPLESQVYYIQVPRVAYLHTYVETILRYFGRYRDEDDFETWFEFEGVPVKWNWPAGLAYDLLTGLDPTRPNTAQKPWMLTLQADQKEEYPKSLLLRIPSKQTLRDYWMHQLKEACVSRDGNANRVMNLSNANAQKMWDSLVLNDFKTFWAVMTTILPRERDANTIRSLPVKVYLPMSNQCIAAIVRPENEDGTLCTVGQALHAHLPTFFPSETKAVVARVVLHGVEVPLEAVLANLYYMAMYPDGFLHISLVMIN